MDIPDTLEELLLRAASEHTDKTAFIWRPRFRAIRFTFGDIEREARKTASLLEEHNVNRGDRVILWAANSPYWVAAFYGCHLRGAIPVPLMMQNTADFARRVAEVTEAKLILKSPHLKAETLPMPSVDLETALMERLDSPEIERAAVTPDDIAEILFTSGTTGAPKGVVLRHRNVLANLRDIRSLGIVTPDDHLLSFLPLAHVFEQITSLFTAMSLGITVTQAASLSGPHIRMNMVEDRPTVMVAVPEFLKLTMERIQGQAEEAGRSGRLNRLFNIGPKLPMPLRRILARPILTRLGGRLRLIVAGGSALDPAVGDKFEAFGITVLQGYGATETSPVISLNLPNNRKTSGVGLPFPSVEVRVAGDGEIAVRGPNVVEGYYQRPEETAARFRDGWYYTDDLGYFDEDGHLHIKGRKKFLIVTPGGENVYPEDLESELNSEPEVKDSAVLAREQDGRFEIHAVLLPVSGAALPNPSQIIERVNERLQPHQRMHGVSVWDGDDFPRTTTRKVKKNDVRNWLEAQGSTATERPAAVAVGAVERAISHATGIPAEEITPEKRMEADLKMDSLGRVTLAGIIEEELGVVLDEGQIAPQTTVADVRALVEHPSQRQERHEFNEQPLTRRAIFWRTLLQRLVLWPIISLFARMTVEGEENIRDLDGPVIFTPNHISPIDGGVLLRMLPARFQARTAIASAADVLYDNPTYGRFKRILELLLNIYPFARQSQVKSSLEYTGRLMDRGFSIMLFPEGHIAMDQHLQPIKRGAGLIAVEMQAPVVPVAMTGIERMVPADSSGLVMPKRARGTVRFGKPIHFHLATDYEAAAREIGESIAALLPEEYQPAPDASPTSD